MDNIASLFCRGIPPNAQGQKKRRTKEMIAARYEEEAFSIEFKI